MKKISQIQEELKAKKVDESIRMDEANKYLDFAKDYYKKHGVSGPFDPKLKKDGKSKKFMQDLSKAWKEHKEKTDKKEK